MAKEIEPHSALDGHVCIIIGDLKSKLKKAQADNKRLQTIIDNRAEDLEVKTKYEAIKADNKRPKEALEKYGEHHRDCAIRPPRYMGRVCTCGLDQTLKGGE